MDGNDLIAFHFNHFHVEKRGEGVGFEIIGINGLLVFFLEIVSEGCGEGLHEIGGVLAKVGGAGGEWMKGGTDGFG